MFNLKSIKTQLIIYLACLALFLVIKDGDSAFPVAALIAVVSALLSEAFFLYLKTKTLQITESAVITGLIVAFVLSGDEAWWKIIFASVSAISSKHLIAFKKKHIFNPAALGIFLTLILFGAATQWRGTYLWYILVPFGLYFTQKINKIEIIIGYALASLVLFGMQAFSQRAPLWDIFGYFSYFYIFVMVVEPKTTPVRTAGKYIFGICTAALIFILTEAGVKFDVELFSLLAMNAAVPLLNKL